MTVPVLELMDHTRNEILRDVVGPYLYSEDALLRFLNEGYKQFARRTHCFVDELTTLETVAGTARYDLPADTIFLREVYREDGVPLSSHTRRAKPSRLLTGKPIAYTTDTKHSTVKFYPTPDAAYTLELTRAIEAPTVDLSSDIDLPYEQAMLLPLWMAYRALQNNDPDGSETINGRQFFNDWGVGLKEAKIDYTRQAMGDNPSAQPRHWT